MLHIFFVCRQCDRVIGGCLPHCPEVHKVEKVECCALCINRNHAETLKGIR